MYGSTLCLLLLALVCHSVDGNPLRTSGSTESTHAQCAALAKELLISIKSVLYRDTDQVEKSAISTLFHGFNCTELETIVNPDTQTASVCQPSQDMSCPGQKQSSFSEVKCLQSIAEDLTYHQARLEAYMRSLDEKKNSGSITELRSITSSIQNLQQSCLLLPKPTSQPESWTTTDTFVSRKNLCKQLKGFHVRAITITRALGYICAGEYKK